MAKAKAKARAKAKSAPAQTGRPTKLTPEIHAELVGYMREGCYLETAAALAGVHKDTVYEWLQRGEREPGSEFARFSDALKAASALAEDRAMRDIAASPERWQARAWFLERRFPHRWAQRRREDDDDDNTKRPITLTIRTTPVSDDATTSTAPASD